MTCFPDVNIWIALAVAEHIHHEISKQWFDREESEIAWCRVTQMGVLRLLTNPRVMNDNALSCDRAWRILDRFQQDSRITFATEPDGLVARWREYTRPNKGSHGWTDAYLAAFASESGFTLVTFDRGFSRHKDFSVRLLKPHRPS